MKKERDSQRLQTDDPELTRQGSRDEWQNRAACDSHTGYPGDGSVEEGAREKAGGLMHHYRIHGSEEEADCTDGDEVGGEGGDEPNC
jgi:hypothetical protein